MKTILICGAFLLLACTGRLHAEHGCPSGYVPVYQDGQQVCTVDYNLPSWRSGQGQPSATGRAPMEDRWGAIASDGKGHAGIVVDYVSKQEAEAAAIEECGKRGGIGCEVMLAYYNQCAAVATNEKVSTTYGAPSEERAKALALRECEKEKAGGLCWIYYSGCSLPARVR